MIAEQILSIVAINFLFNSVAPSSTTNVIVASQSGAVLNADLLSGGGTDDTAALQRILNRASNGKSVHLVLDGPALVSGLDVHSNTTIECTGGGGMYLKRNANRSIIRNAHRTRESVLDRNIVVRGCFFNGNRHEQRVDASYENGRYNPLEADGTFQSGLQFFGVQHLTIENSALSNIRSFGIWIANARMVRLNNIVVDTGLPAYPEGKSLAEQRKYMKTGTNDDGVHLNGPIQYAIVDGLKVRTLDDAIALNANDHAQDDITAENLMGPYVGQGAISDVIIRNVVLMEAHQGIRLLSRDQRIDRILIENVTGTVRQRVIALSHFTNTAHVGNFGSISINNVTVDPVDSPPYLELYPEFRDYMDKRASTWDVAEESERPLVSLNSPIESLSLRGATTKAVDGRPLIRVGRDAVIQALNVELSIYDPDLQAQPIKVLGRIDRLALSLNWNGNRAIRYEGGSVGEIRYSP